jgi:ribosomal protein S18 acetylase RimI-like enzyme
MNILTNIIKQYKIFSGGIMENIIELNDSKNITSILNNAFMTVAQKYNYTKENAPGFPAFINYDVIERQLNNGLKMYGYKTDDKIIACVGYSYDKGQIYFIERLATLPEYRHLGIGKKLMDFIENKIRENNGKIAEIHIVNNNGILKDWYKKLGYKEIRIEEPKTLPFKVGIMNKELK